MREFVARTIVELMERAWLPDFMIRSLIRSLFHKRLTDYRRNRNAAAEEKRKFAADMVSSPIALVPEKANEQHYEIPSELYGWMLGPRRKYSSCFYESPTATLADAEKSALRLTCEHAALADGQRILELGCGWGSLTLWMLEQYPQARITSVSNSASQRAYIEEQARLRGWSERLKVITADMNEFQTAAKFDRVVSVEMFEHMRNWPALLHRIAGWLEDEGKLLVHVFCHRELMYAFETEGAVNWMGRYFFSGGMMPSLDVFSFFESDLKVARSWEWSGSHYARTAEHWLDNMQLHRREILPALARTYGKADASRWFQRWRLLFLAGAEMFAMRGGEEWLVGHFLLEPVRVPTAGRDEIHIATR